MKNNEEFSSHCLEMFEIYSAYIDGELDKEKMTQVENHMNTCSECQSCIATLKKTKELCAHMPYQKAPDRFTKTLHEKIHKIMKADQR